MQSVLVGNKFLSLDELTSLLREDERIMGKNSTSSGDQALVIESSNQERSSKKENSHKGNSRSTSRARDREENLECYYCRKKVIFSILNNQK